MEHHAVIQGAMKFGQDYTGPIFLAFVVLAFLAWMFFCWRSSWQKIYDTKTGKMRYLPVPHRHTPFITFPPNISL